MDENGDRAGEQLSEEIAPSARSETSGSVADRRPPDEPSHPSTPTEPSGRGQPAKPPPPPAFAPQGPRPSVARSAVDKEDEFLERSHAMKVGLLGGRGVGKSYLFQAMMYRVDDRHSGALHAYLHRQAVRVYGTSSPSDAMRRLDADQLVRDYSRWSRLDPTFRDTQYWYRMRLPYRTGWIGRAQAVLDADFLDGSGEGFAGGIVDDEARRMWELALLPAPIMVFCLPLWAVFPLESGLIDEDLQKREVFLDQFARVVTTYDDLREKRASRHAVRTVLALTMADDRRCALRGLIDRWIDPYMTNADRYLKRLRTSAGLAQYLASARAVSEYLHEEFRSKERRINRIPRALEFGGGPPWLVPLTAIDGAQLSAIEKSAPDRAARLRRTPPVPAHVELPLLLALCEKHNALM